MHDATNWFPIFDQVMHPEYGTSSGLDRLIS